MCMGEDEEWNLTPYETVNQKHKMQGLSLHIGLSIETDRQGVSSSYNNTTGGDKKRDVGVWD